MECEKLKNWHVCWKSRNKLSGLDLEGGYTDNIHPFYISLYGQFYINKKVSLSFLKNLKMGGGVSYWKMATPRSLSK